MTEREKHMVSKFLGLVGRMRKHQLAYFRGKMEYDLKQSKKYEQQVDDYIRLLMKEGYTPTFEDQQTGSLF